MSTPTPSELPAVPAVSDEPWVEIRVKIPAPWKRWLEEVAEIRALSVSAIVRQCIRTLMIEFRKDREGQ